MSQFIRAIEIDQTPNKLMYQYGSDLAEQANRDALRQQQMMKIKADQEKDMADAFNNFYKLGFEQLKTLPKEEMDIQLAQLGQNLARAIKESNGDIRVFHSLGYNKALNEVYSAVKARESMATAGEEYAKSNPLLNKEAIAGFTAKYRVTPGSQFSLEKFNEDLQKDINEKPHIYINGLKTEEALEKRLDEKGVEFKRGETFDPTGSRKLTGAIDTQKKDWEDIGKFKLKNGIEVELPKISMEKVSGPFGTSSVITGEVYNRIVNNPALELKMVQDAKKLVHKINSAIGVNTSAMTREQFDAARSQFPELVDPFNDGVISVYKRKVLTDRLKSNYDENGFSLAGQRQVGLDVSKPTGGSGGSGGSVANAQFVDGFAKIENIIAPGKQYKIRREGGQEVGGLINQLDSRVAETLVSIANKISTAGTTEEGTPRKYTQRDLVIRPNQDGSYQLIDINTKEALPPINREDFNTAYNETFGNKAQSAAVKQPTQPVKPAASGIKWK